MKIGERWAISGNRGDFALTEYSVRKDEKTGKDKVVSKQTYHPTIEQCLRKIVKAETGVLTCTPDAITATELLEGLEKINNDIKESARVIEAAIQVDSQQTDPADQA